MTWYEFNQNNSGGSFDYDGSRGISHKVFIEADSAALANVHANYIGIYFDGCDDGHDCHCCGARWYEVDDGDFYTVPAPPEPGEPFDDSERWNRKWMAGYEYFIHPLEGDFYGAGA